MFLIILINRRRVWVRKFIRARLRPTNNRPKHRPLQRRRHLRRLFPANVRQFPKVVHTRIHSPGHRHKFLPTRLHERPRHLVQPAPKTLRPLTPDVPQNRQIRGRNSPGRVPARDVLEEGRDQVRD